MIDKSLFVLEYGFVCGNIEPIASAYIFTILAKHAKFT